MSEERLEYVNGVVDEALADPKSATRLREEQYLISSKEMLLWKMTSENRTKYTSCNNALECGDIVLSKIPELEHRITAGNFLIENACEKCNHYDGKGEEESEELTHPILDNLSRKEISVRDQMKDQPGRYKLPETPDTV